MSAPVQWSHRLPRRRPVSRVPYILDRCRGKRVIHLGFVDEHLLDQKLERGRWLHSQIQEVAEALIGIDIAAAGVQWAQEQGYESYCADAQDESSMAGLNLTGWADVIVAGEIIEHLDAPGFFLRAIRQMLKPDGELIVTTPNTYRLMNAIIPLSGRELIHPDHTSWHSPSTLRVLGSRAGYEISDELYYQNPVEGRGDRSLRWRVARAAKSIVNSACLVFPSFSDGLITLYRVSSD